MLEKNTKNATEPEVTVVIVNWNSGALLGQCLDSLKHQSYANFEIIVLDNNSNDNSFSAAISFRNCRLIKSDANLGFAAGNNLAVRSCSSKYIAFLNPDTVAKSDWLGTLVRNLDENPSIGSVASLQLSADNHSEIDGAGDAYFLSGRVRRIGFGNKVDLANLNKREVFSACAAAALYRRSVFEECEGFDETFFCYLEDIDLGFRAQLLGHRTIFEPKAIVHHVGSATTGGRRSDFSIYYGQRNIVWTFVKNIPLPLLIFLLPFHLLYNLFALTYFSFIGKAAIVTKAKLDAIKGLPKVMQNRELIQKNRKISVLRVFKIITISI
jgi:GT2 family glycosyltransferase